MALYTSKTLADLRTDLQGKLGDTSFWTSAELDLYIAEGLRFWGAITRRWKKRENITLDQSTHWHDLYTKSTNLNPTITDQDLLLEVQYHLLETPNSSGWSGTAQFTLAAVQSAMQGALEEVYAALSPKLEVDLRNIPLTDFVDLSSVTPTVLDVHRAAWKNTSGTFTKLWRADEDEMRYNRPLWNNHPAEAPENYSVWKSQPMEVRLMPRPTLPGQIEFVFQKQAPTLDVTTGVELGIPDDLAWVVKYGILAELLDQEGVGNDTQRAAYCRKRYEDGLEIAKTYTSVLGAEINGVPVHLGRVRDLDAYNANWQNEVDGTPDRISFAGYNLFAVAPSPDAGPHSVLFDVIQPAIVPSTDTDNIQLEASEIEAVLDYAQHLASFKQGSTEFQNTTGMFTDTMKAAMQKNTQLATQTWAKASQDSKTWDELVMTPVGTRNG